MALGDRKTDLIGMYHTAVLRLYFQTEQIAQDGRGKTGGVGIDQEEQRIIRQQLCTELYEGMDRIFDLPDLALRTATVGRRVHDDGIVVVATADLTLYEFYTVIDQPADRSVR